MIDFGLAAELLVQAAACPLEYTQGGETVSFAIAVDRSLRVIDEMTGGSQYISAATFANNDFPFDDVEAGDTIKEGEREWRVLRKLADDGFLTTVEIR